MNSHHIANRPFRQSKFLVRTFGVATEGSKATMNGRARLGRRNEVRYEAANVKDVFRGGFLQGNVSGPTSRTHLVVFKGEGNRLW